MKRLLLLIIMTLVVVKPICSQENIMRYVDERKDPYLASALSLAAPGAGHFYVQKPMFGILFIATSLVAADYLIEGKTTYDRGLGAMGLIAIKVVDVVFAFKSANSYNRKLKKQLNISAIMDNKHLLATIRYDF